MAFCNWLVRERRFGRNPLAHLQRLNTETDVRRKRRVLTPEELARHSTITLTMDRYTHLRIEDLVEALGRLPGLNQSRGA